MNSKQFGLLPLFVAVAFSALTRPAMAQRREALSPEHALQQIELDTDFSASILAHEPSVIDPVEVTFDDAGRMWVVEMRDYPFRTAEHPRGRIQVLEDTDCDGIFETAHTFADHLEMPTGLALWKNGVVVTVAGRLIYLLDSNGDLRADRTEVWLEGFTQDNEQLRANHPRLGPDGKWYIACGLRGGDVKLGADLQDAQEPQVPVLKIGSRDVRLDLKQRSIDLVTGPAQFGLVFDMLGNRLFCSNRNPATQVVLEQGDLTDNPLAGLAPSVVDVIPAGDDSRVFPLVDAWTTSHLHSGQFTAACGVFARAAAKLRTEVFACEPTGSLVRRQLSRYDGRLLVPEQEPTQGTREWLASRDAWFRPVNVSLAPDGELVVVDMHRAVIEHPRWVPEELKHRPDERWGDDAGRVFWVGQQSRLPAVLQDLRKTPLGDRSNGELARLVSNHNPWMRETASRLLLQREASEVVTTLTDQALDESLLLAARVASLRLADQLSPADAPLQEPLRRLLTASSQSEANRALGIVALRLLRNKPQMLHSMVPQIADYLASVDDAALACEACLCFSQLDGAAAWTPSPQRLRALTQTWVESGDRYLIIALAGALKHSPERLLRSCLQTLGETDQPVAKVRSDVAAVARGLASASCREAKPLEELSSLSQRLLFQSEARTTENGHALRLAALISLQEFRKQATQQTLLNDSFWQQLANLISSQEMDTDSKIAAVALLGQSPRPADVALLGKLVRQNTDPSLNEALLSAWCQTSDATVDQYLMDQLAAVSPQQQRVILGLVSAAPQRLELLSQQIEAGKLAPKQIGTPELKKLVARATGEVKKRLQTQLNSVANTNRGQVIADYKPCLELEADAKRGIEIFRKNCASCHRIGEIGYQVGPNISDSRTKQPLELLTAILDPNQVIDNNYFRVVVMTTEGRVVDGIVAEESSEAIVLRGQDDRREVIRRDDIAEMKATGVSLMPEGVESQIDHQSMADLIAYIKGWRYLDGSIPGR